MMFPFWLSIHGDITDVRLLIPSFVSYMGYHNKFGNKVSFIQNINTFGQICAYFCLWSSGLTKRSWYDDSEMGSAQKLFAFPDPDSI